MPSPPIPPSGRPINRESIIRKFLMWWFRQPHGIAYVSVNGSIDMTASLAYLDRLAKQPGPKVSVQHLLAGVIGRTLHHHPAANARIVGRRIIPVSDVAAAMPVNLLGHSGEKTSELGMALVEKLQERNLREVADATRGAVKEERSGRSSHPVMGLLKKLAVHMPQAVLDRSLDALDASLQNPTIAEQFYRSLPVTTGLTNPGAALADLQGAKFTGGAFSLPQKLVHVGTLWGVTPIADDVFAIDGKPEVRPALPVLLVFDHRLIDGVAAGRMLQFAFHILQNPEVWFGSDGLHRGPDPV
jgi:pyruvate/2-oxoglutarate dehydrogenase complex dihydrolipoamide acyltransferase (E2) component